MAKTPVEFIIKALDGSTPVLRALTVRAHALAQGIERVTKHSALGQLKGLGKAIGVDRLGGALSNVGDAAGKVAQRFGLVAAIAGAAFVGLIRSTEAAGSRLQDVSQRVGLTADGFASLEYAAKRGGVGAEEFAAGMGHLTKNLGEMKVGKGGGPLLGLLNQVSPALAKQVKAAKGTDQAMALLADAFSRIEDPAKRAVLAQAAFGKSGAQLGSWLHEGRGSMQALQSEFIRLAGSQEKFAANAGQLGDKFDSFEVSLTGLRNQLGGAFFQVVGKVIDKLTELLVSKRANIVAWAERAAAALERWIDGGGFERLVDFLGKVGSAIGTVVEWLGPMGTAFAAGAVMAAPLIAALASLAGTLISIGATAIPLLLASPLAPFLLALGSLAYLGKVIYDNWGDLSLLFSDFGGTIGTTFANLDRFLTEVIEPTIDSIDVLNIGLSKLVRFAAAASGAVGLINGINLLREGLSTSAAESAAPQRALGGASRVTVDFANAPRGTRVSSESTGNQSLDVGVGYSMAGT